MSSPKLRWRVWGAFLALWTALLVMPSPAFDKVPGVDLLQSYRYMAAKGAHVTGYALLAILSGWLQVSMRMRWLMMFVIMGHACLTEMIQYHIPALHRTGDLNDVAFDHVGVAIGLALSWNWWMTTDKETGRQGEKEST